MLGIARPDRAWVARLTARAATLAAAAAERRRSRVRADGAHWRKAGLLWPLFTNSGTGNR